MPQGLRALLLAALLVVPAMPAGAQGLKPFRATFAITWHGMSAGTTRLELQRLPDGRWSYGSQSVAKGLFRLAMPADLSSRSVFRVHEDRIRPDQFIADDGSPGTEKDQRLDFDWARGRVTGVVERKPVDMPADPGLLDTMSVQVALMHELLAGRQPTRFVLLDKDRIKDYVYATAGGEVLRTAIGEHRTVVFRSSRPGSDKATLFWCAPELGYVPLKVERRDGKDVEWSMALRKLEFE